MVGMLLVLLYFALAALAAVVIMQPDRFVVTRTAVIDAAPEAVFDAINRLRAWEGWSPWAALDPQASMIYEGPAAGPGAAFEWSGNKNVGAGRMTILDSRAHESVTLQLDMRKPFVASNVVTFLLAPETGAAPAREGWLGRAFGFGNDAPPRRTHVTWTMSGRAGLLAKALNLVINRDKMVGGQFEQGLANLDALLSK